LIDIIDDIIAILNEIEDLDGRVYRRWPKKKAKMPAVLVSRISGNVQMSDADGSEVIANLTYSIDVNADSQDVADVLVSKAVNALSRYNLHRTGLTDFYDDELRVYRAIITLSVTVDRRGNTFTY